MQTAVKNVFNATASTYDTGRAKLIPGFNRFYAAAIDQIPTDAQRILDLGAGTGLLSAFVRERLPNARIHLIDNSEPMLAKAKARFSADDRITYQADDYTTADWGSSYDAIVSALSIHHLDDLVKQKLFQSILHGLRPGGVFVNAEQILAPTPELESAAKDAWLREVRALGATEEQIDSSLIRQQEDRCATISAHLKWLRNAGYDESACVLQLGRFAVITGRRVVTGRR